MIGIMIVIIMQVKNIKYVHVWFVWKTFNVQSQLFLALFAKFEQFSNLMLNKQSFKTTKKNSILKIVILNCS